MVDLAIGIIVVGAIGRVITSLVNDILMPPIGFLLGRVNFTSLYINLGRTKYPTFGTVIDFFLISLVIFFVVRTMNRLRERFEKKVVVAPPTPTTKVCPFCKLEIAIDATRCPHCTSELTAGK
jgi:large conductance mechanosensitive channel